jgi:colicin import membrane protein
MMFSRLNRARDSNGLSLNRMIGLSLFIHIIALSILVFSPSLPSPKWTFGPVYNVQLVNLQDISFKGNASSVLSREILTPSPASSAIVLKRSVDTFSSVPIRSVDIQKKQDPQREKAVEAVRKKVLSSEKAASRPATAGTESAATTAALSNREANEKMASYYAAVWAKIKGQWSLPRDILSKENMESVIQAKILRNGAISDISFEKRSGNRFFDDSAMKAIKKANPLPPLPGWIRDNSIEIGIRFHSSEFRR